MLSDDISMSDSLSELLFIRNNIYLKVKTESKSLETAFSNNLQDERR